MLSNQEIEEDRLAAAKRVQDMIGNAQAQHPLGSIVASWQKKIQESHQDNLDRLELQRLRGIVDKTDLLKSQLEAAKRSENMHRDFCDKLRKEIAELKEKKASSVTIKLYECPHCREFVNMAHDRVLKHNAYWHEACWLKSKRNGKVSHFRRRARRWRNFKLFLSRAFWSFW